MTAQVQAPGPDFFSSSRMDLILQVQVRTETAYPGNDDMRDKVNTAISACSALLVVDDVKQAKTMLDGLSSTMYWLPDDRWAVAGLIYRRLNFLKACLLPIHGRCDHFHVYKPPQEFDVYEPPQEFDGFDPTQDFVGLDEDRQLEEYDGFEAALDKYYYDKCLEYMEEQEIERAFDGLDDVDKYYYDRLLECMEEQEIERASSDSDDSVWFYDSRDSLEVMRDAYYDFLIRECLLYVEIKDACNVVYDIEEPKFGFFERLCYWLYDLCKMAFVSEE